MIEQSDGLHDRLPIHDRLFFDSVYRRRGRPPLSTGGPGVLAPGPKSASDIVACTDFHIGKDFLPMTPSFLPRETPPPGRANRLQHDIECLSCFYPLLLDDNWRFVIVQGVLLPPGYNRSTVDFLLGLPRDYPLTPPGIGENRIYTSPDLRFRGHVLCDLHRYSNPPYAVPNPESWGWFCYEEIDWDPVQDQLIKFMEMVRADLTEPRINKD